ncbi:uncharacterized protein LOC141535672 [Cotesia typhae]|uniref:uncharacterized protein LOC141535672 n=1 Tax=Cotesia typhae TaxID=2053667 RepID=UPI003D69A75F
MDVVAADVNGGNAEVTRDHSPDPGADVCKSTITGDVNTKDFKSKGKEDADNVKENQDLDQDTTQQSDAIDGKKDVKDKVGDKLVSDEVVSIKESNSAAHDSNKMDDQDKEVNGDVKGVSVSKKSIVTPVSKRKLRKVKANSTSTVESEPQDSSVVNTNSSSRTRNQKRKLSEPDNHSSDDSEDFLGFDSSEFLKPNPAVEILKRLIAQAEAEVSTPQPPAKRQKLSLSKVPPKKSELKAEDPPTETKGKKKAEKIDQSGEIAIIAAVKNNASGKSPPSAKTPVARRGMRNSHASPALSIVPKVKVPSDVTQPEYKEPFKYGWKRELVYKNESDPAKKTIEVSYYTPKGKRVRSLREVAEFLSTEELTIDNFIFTKEPTGINDPQCEIIKDEPTAASTPVNAGSAKKVVTGKRVPVPKRLSGKTSPLPAAKTLAKALPIKTSTPGLKVKVPVKRGAQKKEISPPKETDVHTWTNSSSITRRTQGGTEKASPYKSKRSLKTKLQEPCSIRCAMSMGLIPSLQCRVCLCLYHPECVGHAENSVTEDYVCKNCRQDNEESRKVTITPPPLIPISMIGTETAKSLFPAIDRQSPLKAPKNLKPDNYSKNSRDSFSTNKLNTAAWYSNRDSMQRQDGSEPKPAQNIAIVNGKKFIVVPKNNAGSVQPAIRPRAPNRLSMIDDNDRINSINYPRDLENREPRVLKETMVNYSREEIRNLSNDKSRDAAVIDPDQRRNSGDQAKTDGTANLGEETRETIPVVQEVKEPAVSKEQEEMSKENLNEIVNTDEKVEKMSNEKILEMIEEKILKSSVEMAERMDVDEPNTSDEQIREAEFDGSRENFDAMEVSEQKGKENLSEKKIEENIDKESVDRTQVEVDKKKAVVPMVEVDQRQYFMATVCSGYNALTRVFQYLKVQELLRAARVCKMWRDIAVHPSLWKTVRMKNSQVTDWDGLVATLQRHGTQHLDLRKMLVAAESDSIWEKFVAVIPNVKTLVKLELCRCPVMVVEEVIKACPQLQVLTAMSIKCDWLNLNNIDNLKSCQELRLKAITGMSLYGDLTPLQNLSQLSHLSLTSVKELGKKKIEILGSLANLESLELGECSDFPSKFGTSVLCKLTKLERLRLEKGQGSCCTFDILKGVAKLEKLHQLELVNFDVKNGFDKHLANCKNIKRLLIIPTYISQSATSNNMVLGGVCELSNSLTYFVWGVTLELLRVTQLFVDQCNQMDKQVSGDSIPVLKPVPCLSLIEDLDEAQSLTKEEKSSNSTNPQVDILPLPQLKKLLAAALPKTRVKILMIPFHATWRQSISDSASQ